MLNNAYTKGKHLLCGDYTQYTPAGAGLFIKAGRYSKVPKRGSVVYFYSNSLKRIAHVGIVIDSALKNGVYTFNTVEGNTSAGSGFSRNGGCVAKKHYSVSSSQIGGTNRVQGFGEPAFSINTADVDMFINVALNEVGYEEKASNSMLDDKHANAGDNNYTKYGKWYGGNGLYWCQQFVSWCAYEACRRMTEKSETKWVQESGRWRYINQGKYVKGQWLEIGGRWYVFDNAGCMVKGWFKSDQDWYYMNEDDGTMCAGQWIEKNNKSYYLTKSGIMAKYCYVAGKEGVYYWVNENGEYQKQFDTKTPNLAKYELAV